MIQLLTFLFMLNLISMMLLYINIIISKKIIANREKISPFECGFDPISPHHLPFSNQFFMISLIFLIFDIEITLFIPLINLMYYFNQWLILYSFIFLFLLLMGLYLEYLEFSMDWKI